jgi:hypothetical protein
MQKHCEKHSRNYYNQCHYCYIEEAEAMITSESNDRNERKSCGDADELAAQDRWLRKIQSQ